MCLNQNVKKLLFIFLSLGLVSCATITNDPNVPVTLSFSDGSGGQCSLTNKRGSWQQDMPGTASIRRSDDNLQYNCVTDEGKTAIGSIPSEIGAKLVASAVFIDFGITDAITDKHRIYPSNFVIPVK